MALLFSQPKKCLESEHNADFYELNKVLLSWQWHISVRSNHELRFRGNVEVASNKFLQSS